MKIVYKVTNQETGKSYIGVTTRSIEERKADHIQKANKGTRGHFQEAIATYGADAFKWEQIDSANSTNELAEKERQYILQYNSKEQGYNSDSGGGFKKIIYQFNEAGVLINSFSSLKEIETTLNYDKRRVSNACTTATLWKGSYWSYSLNKTFKPATVNRKKQVTQFTLDGVIIAKYSSVSEASRITGLSKTCISRCCRGERKSSSGFLWKYQD
ncbi:endonuclease [Flavobacterium ranwuense]|uniref:Endonuclease n=2 Tax=Flavobacterium ranwuense TaxID=2541725 RepID=A0ABY2DW81_9FLAO|nr:endonuclease [Flavobacterium ranwuense]